MMKLWRLSAVLIVMVLLVACSGGAAPEAETEADASVESVSSAGTKDFPFMGLPELDAFLAENTGKPTMAVFWTTWCPSCKQELPEMEQLNKTHGDKMNIITISLDEKVEALEQYFKKGKLDIPVYWGDQSLAEKFNVSAIPTLVIFNKQGKMTFSQAGIFPHSMLTAMADKLIGQ